MSNYNALSTNFNVPKSNYWNWFQGMPWEYAFTLTFRDDQHLPTSLRLVKRYFSEVDRELYDMTLRQHKNTLKRVVFLERSPARRRHTNGQKKRDWISPDKKHYITNWSDDNYKREGEMVKIRAQWSSKEFWHVHGLLILPKDLPYNQKAGKTGPRTPRNIIQVMTRKWSGLIDLAHKDHNADYELRHPAGSSRFDPITDETQRKRCISYVIKTSDREWSQTTEDIYGVGDMLLTDVCNLG